MTNINQTRSQSLLSSIERNRLSESSDLEQTPLEKLMDEANAGNDLMSRDGQSGNNSYDDAVDFASPGPIPSLLRQPLINSPLTQSRLGGVQLGTTQPALQTDPGKYTVKSGDTLAGIASANDMTLDEMIALNPQIRNTDQIHPGDRIIVSASKQ